MLPVDERRWPRTTWRVVSVTWALICVIQAIRRLDQIAEAQGYTLSQAWTEGLLWLMPLVLTALAGLTFPRLVSARGGPARRLGGWFLPLLAVVAAFFAWSLVVYVAGAAEARP